MGLENYQGTALEDYIEESNIENNSNDSVIDVEPEQTEVVETVDSDYSEDTTNETEPEDITSVYIPDLGDVSFDEIKEWRNGNMRQSDYTKKTQELARHRENLQEAEQLYNLVISNPQYLEALKNAEGGNASQFNNATPEAQAIRQLMHDQKALETDIKLKALEEKYGEIDVVALLSKATELRTDDLEFVWNGLTNNQNKNIDSEAIRREAYEKAKNDLKSELEANRDVVSTTISTKQQTAPQAMPELSSEEKKVARAMGLSESEYIKWRT